MTPPIARATDDWLVPRRLGEAVLTMGGVDPGTRFRRHGHDGPHLCCVLAGGFVEAQPAGAEDVGPGTVRFSPSARHDIDFSRLGARCIVIELDPSAGPAAPRRSLFMRDPWLGSLVGHVGRALARSDPSARPALDHFVSELLAQVLRRRNPRASRVPPAWLAHVRELVRDSAGVVPEMAELAARAGVDRAHLARAFRDHYGVTIGALARRLRVERATRLLRDADATLAEVAIEAGFADQSHMTRAIAVATGSTPARLRTALRAAE